MEIKQYAGGTRLLYQGREILLKLEYAEGVRFAGVRLSDNEIRIRTGETGEETIRRILFDWYQKKAKEQIPERTARYARLMKETYRDIRIKDQKTRWGSCSSKRNLNFSWRLVMAPVEVMDYVIVHELCHLKFLDHSENFWNHVGEVMPDYKKRQQWLKENGARLMAEFE